MKSVLSVVLAFAIIATVVFIIPNDITFDVKYVASAMQYLGSYPPPTLTNGHDFSSFKEGSQAVIHITLYPLKWSFYCISQIARLGSFFGVAVANHS